MNQFSVPTVLLDHKLRIRAANEDFCRVLGLERRTLIGRTYRFFSPTPGWQSLLEKARRSGPYLSTDIHGELQRCHEVMIPLGTDRPEKSFLVFLVPASNVRSDPSRFYHAQKLASLGTLAAGIAHELRNPLAIIATSLYFLADVLGSEDAVVEKHLRIMQEEVESARSTIEKLLNFARPSAEAESQVDIAQLIEDVLGLLANELLRSDIELEKRLRRVPPALANLDALKQAFFNILTNAIQAMPSGGKLTVESSVKRYKHRGECVVVTFRDTGRGMSEEELARACDPFFTTKPGGTGLGLSITQSNIRKMGGELRISSVSGQGTVVRIILPVGGGNGPPQGPPN